MKLPIVRTLAFLTVLCVPAAAFAGQPGVDSPEPATLALLAAGAIPLVGYLLKRRHSQDSAER